MGYNSTLIITNDALNSISEDKSFGEKIDQAISKFSCYGRNIDISSGPNVNAATVIDCHHADHTKLIAVGGNYGTVLGSAYTWSHHTEDDKINVLRQVAKEMGFDLVKRR